MTRGVGSCAAAASDALLHDPRFALRNVRQLLRLETLRARLARIQRQGARIALFDEGPVYSVARLAAFCPPTLERRPFGAYLARSRRQWARELDLVIMLDAPNVVLAERIRSRAKPHRMRDADDPALFAFLDRYRSAYGKVATDIARDGHTSVVRVGTATTPVRGIGEQVLEAIRAGVDGTNAALTGSTPAAGDRHREFAGH